MSNATNKQMNQQGMEEWCAIQPAIFLLCTCTIGVWSFNKVLCLVTIIFDFKQKAVSHEQGQVTGLASCIFSHFVLSLRRSNNFLYYYINLYICTRVYPTKFLHADMMLTTTRCCRDYNTSTLFFEKQTGKNVDDKNIASSVKGNTKRQRLLRTVFANM